MAIRVAPVVVASAVLILGTVGPTKPATAQEPEIFRALRNEPVNLFDYGIKQLRRLALEAATRMGMIGEAIPTVQVGLNGATSTIEIQFVFPPAADPGTKLTPQLCGDLRHTLIRETFKIGRTNFGVSLSFEERVRRRLAMQFAHEAGQTAKEVVAMGERLSELTYVEVKLTGRGADSEVVCRAPVAKI